MRIIGPAFTFEEKTAALAAARSCLGIKWRHMGRHGLPWGHNVGLDCIGLVMRAVVAAGRPVIDLPSYGREPNGELMKHLDAHLGDRVESRFDIRPCSVVVIKFFKEPRHVGLLSERGTLIHCYDGGERKVFEHVLNGNWHKRVVAGWTL